MASFCKNIVCNEKTLSISDKGELLCKSSEKLEQIMEHCIDFDAITTSDSSIHIAATDSDGKLLYIKNVQNRWGKGTLNQTSQAENIFITEKNNNIIVYFVSGSNLCLLNINNHPEDIQVISAISKSALPFATHEDVYFVNTNGFLVKNCNIPICNGHEVTHIFATEIMLCIKDRNELKISDMQNLNTLKSLTRRHSRNAQHPVVMHSGQNHILAWSDNNTLFSTHTENSIWQPLKTTTPDSEKAPTIFKYCTPSSTCYEMVFSSADNISRPFFPIHNQAQRSKGVDPPLSLAQKTNSGSNNEQLLVELSQIRQKINELNHSIEKISKYRPVKIILRPRKTAKEDFCEKYPKSK